MQIFYHNINFLEKRKFFRRKLQKSLKIVIITSTPGSWRSKTVTEVTSGTEFNPRQCKYFLTRRSVGVLTLWYVLRGNKPTCFWSGLYCPTVYRNWKGFELALL
jgi:hypothetical protein